MVDLSILFTIYLMFAYSLKLFSRQSKVLMLSQILFFIIGAYSAAINIMVFGENILPAVIFGVSASIIVSFLVFALFERYKGNNGAVTVFGIVLVIVSALISIRASRGPLSSLGIGGEINRAYAFSDISFLLLCLFFFLALFLIKKIVEILPIGQYYLSLPADQKIVRPKARRYRRLIYTISAAISSAAGSFFAVYIGYIDSESYQLKEGIFILAFLIITGYVDLVGGLIGTVILISIPEIFKAAGMEYSMSLNLQLLIYALAIFVMFILYLLDFMGYSENIEQDYFDD